MASVKYGLVLALILGVPVMWPLVSSGQMTMDSLVSRGGILIAGCVVGVFLLNILVDSYTQQQRRARRRAAMAAQLEQATQAQRAAQRPTPKQS